MGINNVFSPKRGDRACFDVLTIKDKIETHSAACGKVVRVDRDTVVVRNFTESSGIPKDQKSLVVKRVSLYSPSATEIFNIPSHRGNPNVDRVFPASNLKNWKKEREGAIKKWAEEEWQGTEQRIRENFESRPLWGCSSRLGEYPSGVSLKDLLASEKRKFDAKVAEKIKASDPEAITKRFLEYVRETQPNAVQDLSTQLRQLGVFIVGSEDEFRNGHIKILDPRTRGTYYKFQRPGDDLVSSVHRMLNEISAFPGINLQDK